MRPKTIIKLVFIYSFLNGCSGPINESNIIEEKKDSNFASISQDEEYYIFLDGGKLLKSEWIKPSTISIFKSMINNEEMAIQFADCFMQKVSENHEYKIVETLEELNEKTDDIYQLQKLFNKLHLDDYAKLCAKEFSILLSGDEKFVTNSEERKRLAIGQLRIEFERNPDLAFIKDMTDLNGFLECLADGIIKHFTAQEMITGEAYETDKYAEVFADCLINNPKSKIGSEYLIYRNSEYNFSIFYPSSFEKKQNIISKVPFNVSDGDLSIVIAVNPYFEHLSAEDIDPQSHFQRLKNEMPNAELISYKRLRVDQKDALLIKTRSKITKDFFLIQYHYAIVFASNEYLINFTLDSSIVNDYNDLINEVFMSFKTN